MSRFPSYWIRVLALCLVAVLLAAVTDAKSRRGGKHRGKSSADQKKKTIARIQQQVAAARQVLSAAEADAQMSKAQLDMAMKRLTNARVAIEAAVIEERESLRTLRAVEEEILDAQPDDSPVVRVLDRVEEVREALDAVIDRAEAAAAKGNTDDLPSLEVDRDVAVENLKRANRELARLKRALFENDTRWRDANRLLAAARTKESFAKDEANAGALPSLSAKRQFRNAAELAVAARAVVLEGEAKLKQLGVKPHDPKAKSKPKPTKAKPKK